MAKKPHVKGAKVVIVNVLQKSQYYQLPMVRHADLCPHCFHLDLLSQVPTMQAHETHVSELPIPNVVCLSLTLMKLYARNWSKARRDQSWGILLCGRRTS